MKITASLPANAQFAALLLAGLALFAPPAQALVDLQVPGNATAAERSPIGSFVFSGGFLYITCFDAATGGGNSYGAVMRFNPADGSFSPIHTFAGGTSGHSPSGIIEGNDGHLYGHASGGNHSGGILYRLEKNGTFTILHHFADASGRFPYGEPLQASDGHLYGVVGFGGFSNHGGIYRYNLGTSSYTLHRTFTGTSGATPGQGNVARGLVEGPDGRLYGATRYGGPNSTGVIFALERVSANYAVLHEFGADTPGTNEPVHPSNRLILGSDGLLYGATGDDTDTSLHFLYRIAPDGSGFRVLHRFSNPADGYDVQNPLVEAASGFLYGTAGTSSSAKGSIFRLRRDGSSLATLHRFPEDNQPDSPYSPLFEQSPGVFLGLSNRGGSIGWGSVFRLTTTLERPRVKVPAAVRRSFRGSQIRLRGEARDDLAVTKVEYSAGKRWKTASGTSRWRATIRVKRTVRTARVRIRAVDNDRLFSRTTTIRPRRRS